MGILEDNFGYVVNPLTNRTESVRRFTVTNANKLQFQVISFGATLTSLMVPDIHLKFTDIILGYDSIDGYVSTANPYIGCTVGRMCNFVKNGGFSLFGEEYKLSKNFRGRHQLHGGFHGFSRVNWKVEAIHEDGVTLKLTSPDGHEGYPGEVHASATYSLNDDDCLSIVYEANTNKPTPINLTNHAYFNLAGHKAGPRAALQHTVMINSNQITELDEDAMINGQFVSLNHNPLDLRTPTRIGHGLKEIPIHTKGYDHNYLVEFNRKKLTPQAKVYDPSTERCMTISSNMPCIHFYTANNLPSPRKGQPLNLIGKCGAKYERHSAFCLETQWYPDAVNNVNFPSVITKPGGIYSHTCEFKFDIKPKRLFFANIY